MKIHIIKPIKGVYSSNAYLLRGSNNRMGDINTLIDVGSNPNLIETIEGINTGVGKKAISQVLITHNHFDHTGSLKMVLDKWDSKLMAYSKNLAPYKLLNHNDVIKVADTWCQVIHVPEHSSDSVCFYFPEYKMLFSGDTPINIMSSNITFNQVFLERMEELNKFKISTIYPGHGNIIENASKVIKRSLSFIKYPVEQFKKS